MKLCSINNLKICEPQLLHNGLKSNKISFDSKQFWWIHTENNARNKRFEVHSQMHDSK